MIFILVSESVLNLSYIHNYFCWYHPVSEKTNFLSVVIYVFGLCWRTRLCRVKRYWLFIFFVFNRNKKVENATFIISNYFSLFLGPFIRCIFRCFQSILKNGNCILHTATCLPNLVLGLYTNWYIRENCLTYIQ